MSPARRGSGTGRSVSTDHMSATSSTLRAIGPTVSSVGTSGNTPSVEINPHCDLSPTTSQVAEGRRMEQPVSEPSASSQRPAARAAAEPDDDPPVVLPGCVGLWHVPYHSLCPSTLHANSGRCVLPTMTAPASSKRWTAVAFRSGTWSA